MKTLEERQAEFAAAHRITFEEYKKLVSLPFEEITICLELLKCKQHRSSTRQRSEEKVRAWLAGSTLTSHPLSPKELEWTKPRWPVHIVLPT